MPADRPLPRGDRPRADRPLPAQIRLLPNVCSNDRYWHPGGSGMRATRLLFREERRCLGRHVLLSLTPSRYVAAPGLSRGLLSSFDVDRIRSRRGSHRELDFQSVILRSAFSSGGAAMAERISARHSPKVIPSFRYISRISLRMRATSGDLSPFRLLMMIGKIAFSSSSGRY